MLKLFIFLVLPCVITYASNVCGNNNKVYQIGTDESKYLCPVTSGGDADKLYEHSKTNFSIKYCLFDETAIPTSGQKCQFEPKPLFLAKKNKETRQLISCGFGKHHFLHVFGYNNCGGMDHLAQLRKIEDSEGLKYYMANVASKNVLIAHYYVCYDVSNNKTIWTSHRVLESQSLFTQNFKFMEEFIYLNDVRTDAFHLESDPFSEIKKRYELEKKSSKFVMVPHPMVPTRHFATCGAKKCAKHYINIAPLWDHLIPLMNLIDDGIREASLKVLASHNQVLQVYTRTIDVSDPEISRRLMKMVHLDKTFEQNIWYKFVHNRDTKEGVIIYIHNTPRMKIEKKCQDMKCNFNAWSSDTASSDVDLQYAYCCEISTENINKIIPWDFQVQGFLDIDSILR